MLRRRKGRGKDRNSADEWGDGVSWNVNDFYPAWTLPPDETLDPTLPAPFSTDLGAQSQLYLPFYLNNDGEGNDQNNTVDDGGNDGFDILILSLDSEDSDIGFSQETYVVKESWDAIAGDAPILNSFIVPQLEDLISYQAKTFLVDGNSRPFDTPQLILGGRFREATIIIEDAQSPVPIQLGIGNDVVPGSGIDDTSGVDILYAGAGNDSINSGASDDVVRGEAGDDQLTGGDGDDMLFGEAGADILRGGNSRSNDRPALNSSYRRPAGDYLNGGSGNDRLYGEAGLDRLDGMGGDDILYGDHEDPTLDNPDIGSARPLDEWDVISGGSGNDILDGGADSDKLFGDEGDDYLVGGADQDELEGGAGADRFDFYGSTAEQSQSDLIRDFDPTQDHVGIYVGAGSFFSNTGLPVNQPITAAQFRTITPAQFNVGNVAGSESDRFIYDISFGRLFFDPDGTGTAPQTEIASVSSGGLTNPTLDHTDIVTFDATHRTPPPSPSLPLPPTVQFSQATYQVDEAGGSSTITLSRLNHTTGISQVQVSIVSSTATNADYDASGLPITVTFEIGETSQTIEIPILQDAELESTESITVVLSSINNPALGTIETAIGSVNTATVNILDDDQPTLPIDIIGTPRRDRLIGNALDNLMVGNAGNDRLSGGAGRDRLFGGKGSDTLKGGAGRDMFALEMGKGRDVIQDFRDRQDKLGLTAGLKFKQLTVTQQGRNTMISVGGDQLALLSNVSSALITKADFVVL